MNCPNCVLGDLQFFIRGELRFRTDAQGRPCGNADIRTDDDQCGVVCDTCNATFSVQGFKDDGAGAAILAELEPSVADDGAELEPKAPPPSGPLN